MDQMLDVVDEYGDGYALVTVAGEVDVATAPQLRDRLDAAIDRGPSTLVVDLLRVSFLDSTALGVLIGAHKRCDAGTTSMRIVLTEPRIMKVFEITSLNELFAIYATRAEAVAG